MGIKKIASAAEKLGNDKDMMKSYRDFYNNIRICFNDK